MRDKIAKQYLFTIILVFLLLFIMLVYIFSSFYRTSVSNIRELGVKNIKSEAAMIETYMTKSMDVLWATADTVNYLMEEGASSEEILGYLTKEAEHAAKQVDENFTGIYGYIDGQYLDGIGWVPPADYEPTERVWYTKAKEAGGQIALVPPYLDAQTGTVMSSVSQLLSDGESVVSIDVTLNEVQAITENMALNEIGYGFVMDGTGLVIAHVDEAEKGKDYPTNEKQEYLLSKVFEGEQEYFDMDIDGEACTVFSEQVMEDWYVVMVVQNTLLFSELTMQMCIGIIVSALVFLCIALFLVISAKNIRKFQRKERESRERLDELNTNIIRALAYTIDAKDRYTSGHSQRVADYALAIAKRMGKTEEEQKIIYYAGLLHDIGKIRVPEELINKPGGLTEDEFNQIRVHPVSGYHILKDIHEDIRIAYGAKYHHERYDGKGYPNALEGENIPEIARIIGVADSYDAMASDRRYRDALPQEVIRSEFEKGRGTQFDKEIADIMIQMIDEDKDYTMRQSGRSTKNILVVDDEMMNIKMVEFIFRDTSDFHVFGVENMEETFELLEKQEIHLILLDLKMPDIDGFELYQMIVERYRIPVVLMTADKSIETIQKINELGIDDYVTKPLNAFVVRETVHGIVNSWGSV